jgi:tetratricopeptide (TPR) repeat protein
MRHVFAVCALLAAAVPAAAQPTLITAADHQRAQLHYEEGWREIAAENWAEAAKLFQSAIDIDPKFKLAYYGLGRADMGLKQFTPAAAAYERCRELYEAQVGNRMSGRADADRMIADDTMQLDLAIQNLSKGTQTAQTSAQITRLQQQKQRMQLKARTMDNLSLGSEVPPFLLVALGSAYFRGERFPEAERVYKQALEVDPKTGEAHSNLAVVYLTTGRYDEADREVRMAEKAGFKVNPGLKDDIKRKKSGG